MRKFSILLSICFLFACEKDCKELGITDFEFVTLADLSSEIKEGSGLEITSNTLWTFNDNSGDKTLLGINQNGEIIKKINFNDSRKDWEDITQDENGNLYLGDFGNNDNDRKDLRIYKIAAEDLNSNSPIEPEVIEFFLSDQTEFPPTKSERHFDIEAMFYFENQLFLFSKDRSDPFRGITKLYQLSPTIGTQTAQFIDEFLTDECNKAKGAITAADISPDQSKIAICSKEVVWIFTNFEGNNFFAGDMERYDLPIERKMEGLVFEDDCTLFLVNERADKEAKLYRMKVCN